MRMTVRCLVVVMLCTLVTISLPGLAAQDRVAGAPPVGATLAIVGGTLIDGLGGRPLDQAVVLVDGNRIAAIGTRETIQVPDGAEVVDAAG